MKTYLADSNLFLRFLLKDNLKHYNKAKKYISQAKEGKIKIVLIPSVLFEINYVLAKVYSLKREEIANMLSSIVHSPTLEVENRYTLISALKKYKESNIDLVDIYLFDLAKNNNWESLSFDKDFEKIKKL